MKPCPFCKKDSILVDHEWGDCHPVTNWGVGCEDPACWAFADQDCCWHNSPSEAAKLWDKRVDEILELPSDYIQDIQERRKNKKAINRCPKCNKDATLWKGTVEIYSVSCNHCNWLGGIYTNITDAINAWNEQEDENAR